MRGGGSASRWGEVEADYGRRGRRASPPMKQNYTVDYEGAEHSKGSIHFDTSISIDRPSGRIIISEEGGTGTFKRAPFVLLRGERKKERRG